MPGHQDSIPVLICGAGPAGLTAALVLTVNDVACRIIERQTEPSNSSRALGLQARSMEVLAGLGIAERIEQVAYRLSGARIMRGDRPLSNLPWIPPVSRYPYTYVVPQSGLEEILRTRLTELGVRVERGTELAGLTTHDSGVEAHLVTGDVEHRVSADWLIGADGARSRVRNEVGIDFPERATGETYYLADAILDLDVELGDSAMWLGPEGPLMLMRLPGETPPVEPVETPPVEPVARLWRVFVDVTDAARDSELPPLTEEVLADLLAERGPRGTRIDRLQWTSVFRTRLCLADRYRSGRVFLAGDAAHVFPPFGGQGMNLGIQDAVNLGWRLAVVEHGASKSLLEPYESERRPVAETTIAGVEARRWMFALRNPVARAARDVVLALGSRSRAAARRASLENSQLLTSYARHRPGERPAVGERAPDASLTARTGVPGSVHELFGPDHATLITFSATAASGVTHGSGVCTMVVSSTDDPDGQLHKAYGVRPGSNAWVLVRPDGHIGARGIEPRDAETAVTAMIGERRKGQPDGSPR